MYRTKSNIVVITESLLRLDDDNDGHPLIEKLIILMMLISFLLCI